METSRESVVDLLALDGDNPRSILFQLRVMRDQAATLPGAMENGRLAPLSRALVPIEALVSVLAPAQVTEARLRRLRRDLARMSDLLTDAYLR